MTTSYTWGFDNDPRPSVIPSTQDKLREAARMFMAASVRDLSDLLRQAAREIDTLAAAETGLIDQVRDMEEDIVLLKLRLSVHADHREELEAAMRRIA